MVKGCLLFVETDIDVANLTKIYFAGMGWDVHIATSCFDALKIASQVSPHLIILDLTLPEMDGLEVFRTLRTNTRTAHTPVIFLTQGKQGKGEADLPLAAFQKLASNADDYIARPVDIEELKLRVQGALRRSERESLIDPRSRLPTGRLIKDQLRRMTQQTGWRLLEAHINHFEPFRKVYGTEAGNDVLRFTAMLLGEVVNEHGTTSDFVGHISEDNFVIITKEEKADVIRARLKGRFDNEILAYYHSTYRRQGFMLLTHADGTIGKVPLMTLSISIASSNV